jgi:hypothetical protein
VSRFLSLLTCSSTAPSFTVSLVVAAEGHWLVVCLVSFLSLPRALMAFCHCFDIAQLAGEIVDASFMQCRRALRGSGRIDQSLLWQLLVLRTIATCIALSPSVLLGKVALGYLLVLESLVSRDR